MENVIIASFDPTVFCSRTLSDIKSHQTLQFRVASRDYPRLCTAHLALKMPIVLTTSANIRKYAKAGAYPRLEAVYYDPFTRYFSVPSTIKDYDRVKSTFSEIINREPTDPEMLKFFKRCKNLAVNNFRRECSHAHQQRARPISLDDSDEEEDSTPALIPIDEVDEPAPPQIPTSKDMLNMSKEELEYWVNNHTSYLEDMKQKNKLEQQKKEKLEEELDKHAENACKVFKEHFSQPSFLSSFGYAKDADGWCRPIPNSNKTEIDTKRAFRSLWNTLDSELESGKFLREVD